MIVKIMVNGKVKKNNIDLNLPLEMAIAPKLFSILRLKQKILSRRILNTKILQLDSKCKSYVIFKLTRNLMIQTETKLNLKSLNLQNDNLKYRLIEIFQNQDKWIAYLNEKLFL